MPGLFGLMILGPFFLSIFSVKKDLRVFCFLVGFYWIFLMFRRFVFDFSCLSSFCILHAPAVEFLSDLV